MINNKIVQGYSFDDRSKLLCQITNESTNFMTRNKADPSLMRDIADHSLEDTPIKVISHYRNYSEARKLE
jgi:hypothetical protein